jgi:hypothetical protein
VEKIYTHTFSGNIWSTGYFGDAQHPKCWIETRMGEEAHWYQVDLTTFNVKKSLFQSKPTNRKLGLLALKT